MGADEQWGQMYVDQQSVVAPSSIQIPTSLQPFDFEPMRAATIIEVSDFTGTAIQAAINQAAAMPAGTNPVVHLKKGSYDVSSTITIPAQIPITIVGDGASDHGSLDMDRHRRGAGRLARRSKQGTLQTCPSLAQCRRRGRYPHRQCQPAGRAHLWV